MRTSPWSQNFCSNIRLWCVRKKKENDCTALNMQPTNDGRIHRRISSFHTAGKLHESSGVNVKDRVDVMQLERIQEQQRHHTHNLSERTEDILDDVLLFTQNVKLQDLASTSAWLKHCHLSPNFMRYPDDYSRHSNSAADIRLRLVLPAWFDLVVEVVLVGFQVRVIIPVLVSLFVSYLHPVLCTIPAQIS